MGWLWAALIGAGTFAALRLLGVPRVLGSTLGAALMLGAVGYAVQQRATQPGRPIATRATALQVDPGMIAFRAAIMPASAEDARSLAAADRQIQAGNPTAAAAGLLDAIGRSPRSHALWTGLGSALTAHDGDQLSPAARYAFRRAWQLAPDQPGPPFFLGQAYLQSGDLAEAKTAWLRALRLSPRDVPWRIVIAERLVLIDQFQAMMPADRQP